MLSACLCQYFLLYQNIFLLPEAFQILLQAGGFLLAILHFVNVIRCQSVIVEKVKRNCAGFNIYPHGNKTGRMTIVFPKSIRSRHPKARMSLFVWFSPTGNYINELQVCKNNRGFKLPFRFNESESFIPQNECNFVSNFLNVFGRQLPRKSHAYILSECG